MRRGEVWWADAGGNSGRRPVLLLHRDIAYGRLRQLIVAEITSTLRELPSTVLLTRADGLPIRCEVNLDFLLTLRDTALREYITALSREKMQAVDDALRFVLAL